MRRSSTFEFRADPQRRRPRELPAAAALRQAARDPPHPSAPTPRSPPKVVSVFFVLAVVAAVPALFITVSRLSFFLPLWCPVWSMPPGLDRSPRDSPLLRLL